MIHWTELREARDTIEGYQPIDATHEVALSVVRDAVRVLLAFPTDEQVEAIFNAVPMNEGSADLIAEAVRRTMFGETA